MSQKSSWSLTKPMTNQDFCTSSSWLLDEIPRMNATATATQLKIDTKENTSSLSKTAQLLVECCYWHFIGSYEVMIMNGIKAYELLKTKPRHYLYSYKTSRMLLILAKTWRQQLLEMLTKGFYYRVYFWLKELLLMYQVSFPAWGARVL